jgi:hypothetical protein
MRKLVFQIPFQADPMRIDQLARDVDLVETRPDDWDSQLGFRLFGTDGAIRLFRIPDGAGTTGVGRYEILGTAVRPAGEEAVAAEFGKCAAAIERIRGTVMKAGVVQPYGIELGGGEDEGIPELTR